MQAVRRSSASSLPALELVTELLQRVRRTHPTAGIWEAADVQWWWRRPRASDEREQIFWFDDDGPIAAVLLTEWGGDWQCDPIVVPGLEDPQIPELWRTALNAVEGLSPIVVPVRDDDELMLRLLAEAGFTRASDDGPSGSTWMAADDRPPVGPVVDGYALVDRENFPEGPHWLSTRSGPDVEERLRHCSLYDPELDLAVVAPGGEVAGYGLFWCDPVTSVGLLEPMRTEDAHQRQGLARALLTEGLDRLAKRGCRRMKVGYATAVGRDLYTGVGFRPDATTTWFVRR